VRDVIASFSSSKPSLFAASPLKALADRLA
jgi:hypothetical protein